MLSTRYRYDPAAQLVEVIEGYVQGAATAPADGSDVNVSTGYAYTPAGNLASIVDANGNVTRFEYTAAGQVSKEVNAAGNAWSYEYDTRGLLTSERTPNGTIRYGYTARGDRAIMSFPGMDAGYEYSGEQQLIGMTDPTGATGWIYDPVGRLVEQLDSNGRHLGGDRERHLTACTVGVRGPRRLSPPCYVQRWVSSNADWMCQAGTPWAPFDSTAAAWRRRPEVDT